MFEIPIAPIQSPCRGCAERHEKCWSACSRYAAYRSDLDCIRAREAARLAVEEAGVARGDKIRRDVHKYGLNGRRKP